MIVLVNLSILRFIFFLQMMSGGIFIPGVNDMAIKLSKTHYYVYDHVNKFTFNSVYGPGTIKFGSTHGDELMSLFLTAGLPEIKGDDLKISKLLVDIWTRFASTEYVLTYVL